MNIYLAFILNIYLKFRAYKLAILQYLWLNFYRYFYNRIGESGEIVLAYDEAYDTQRFLIYGIYGALTKTPHHYLIYMAQKKGLLNLDIFSEASAEKKYLIVYLNDDHSFTNKKIKSLVIDPITKTQDDDAIIGGMIVLS